MRRGVLAIVPMALIALLFTERAIAGDWRTVETRCGFTLQLPAGWTITHHEWPFGREADCAVALRPRGWLTLRENSTLDVSEFAIYVGEREGRRYYFCCAHCLRTFEKAHVA
jgi:hypothetical protein